MAERALTLTRATRSKSKGEERLLNAWLTANVRPSPTTATTYCGKVGLRSLGYWSPMPSAMPTVSRHIFYGVSRVRVPAPELSPTPSRVARYVNEHRPRTFQP